MDIEDPATFDEGYYEGLSPINQDDFKEEFENNLKEISEVAIERQLRAQYNENTEHFELIRAACGCFHPGGGAAADQSDFKFAGTNPLVGIEETPADVALVKEEYNRVTVEIVCCEVGGETRGDWVENINAAHHFFSGTDTRARLKRIFNVNDRDLSLGYVTLTREEDTVNMDFPVLEANCNATSYAVWERDSGDRCIRHVGGQLNHPDLEAVFGEEVDYLRRDQSLYVAVGSHPIFGLKEVLFKIIKENQEFGRDEIDEFNRSSFDGYYDELLAVLCRGNSRSNIVDREIDRHLESGKASRILTTDQTELNTDREYRVVYSGPRGPQHAQESVEPRYFENMPAYERGRRAYEQTKDEFQPFSELSDFPDKDANGG